MQYQLVDRSQISTQLAQHLLGLFDMIKSQMGKCVFPNTTIPLKVLVDQEPALIPVHMFINFIMMGVPKRTLVNDD